MTFVISDLACTSHDVVVFALIFLRLIIRRLSYNSGEKGEEQLKKMTVVIMEKKEREVVKTK